MPLQVGGSTEVVMPVPKGVDGKLVRSSPRFGHGVNETFGHSRRREVGRRGMEVKSRVLVPADDDTMPMRVEFAPQVVGVLSPMSAERTANRWLTLRPRL